MCKSPALPSVLLDFCISSTTRVISAWYLPILRESMLFHNLSPRFQPPTIGSQHPLFLFYLIFLVRSFMITILRCCFISSSSVDSSCLLCRRYKFVLSKKRENSSPAMLSPLSYSRFLVFAYSPPLQRSASIFKSLFLAVFNFVLVQDFLFQLWSISFWLRPLHFFISSASSFSATLSSSFTSSMDHPDTFFVF